MKTRYRVISMLITACLVLANGYALASESKKTADNKNEDYTVFCARINYLELKADNTLWMFGHSPGYGKVAEQIMDNVTTAAAGEDFYLAVKNDGSLLAWGDNGYGSLGNGTKRDVLIPTKIMSNVEKCYVSMNTSMAIKKDGSLWVWGRVYNYNKSRTATEFNNGEPEIRDWRDVFVNYTKPKKIANDVKSVSIGETHYLILKNDGSVWVWGENRYGSLGVGEGKDKESRKPIKIMDGATMVSAGALSSMAIKEDGSLWAWGRNTDHQLGINTGIEPVYEPTKVMEGIKSVHAVRYSTFVIKKDDSLWAWGHNGYIDPLGCGMKEYEWPADYSGGIGEHDYFRREMPIKLMDNVKSFSASDGIRIAIKKDNTFWLWSSNDRFLTYDSRNYDVPQKIDRETRVELTKKSEEERGKE